MYRIVATTSNKTLHADDKGDQLVSTRYQTDDGYSMFAMENVGDAKRIRVVADSEMIHADDEGTDAVSTLHQNDDDFNHFYLLDRGDGTVNIQTKASGRYWHVHSTTELVITTTNKEKASAIFRLEKAINPMAGACYAVLSPGFNPSYDTYAISGVVNWPCRNDEDCSLNGKCSRGSCQCRPAWKGLRCEMLALLPADRDAGYRGVDGGRNTSSWGGAALRGPDGKWHMWAAEMTEHCGIGAWVQNSRIIRATADSPGGPYSRTQVVWEVFAHEPEVVPAPGGEYIMYYTANPRSEHGYCDCCRVGEGPCDGSTGPGDCPSGGPGEGASYMSHTTDPVAGNWSDPVQIFDGYRGGDTNFAPFILANGSLVAMWRRWGSGNGGSRQYLATGHDWRDPSTYVQHQTELFPDLGAAGTEDQYLYMDKEGNFHAVFHHMYGTGTETQWWLDATGGHAFSRNGWDWTYTGVAWGNATSRYNTADGQGAYIPFTDGTTTRFTRLERPHLIFGNSKTGQLIGDPTHLICSAQYGSGTNPGSGAQNDDACYTLVIPVNQGS